MIDTTKLSLAELIQHATLLLDELNYSEGTKYRYVCNWKHLQKYANTRNYNVFSSELGEAFLLDSYGIKQGNKLSSSQVFKVRSVKVLNEYLQHQTFRKCHQSTGRKVPNQFKNILMEYIHEQKVRQLSKRTIKNKEILIIRFLCFLDKGNMIDISSLCSIDVFSYLDTLNDYSNSTKSGIIFILRDYLAFLVSKGCVESGLNKLFPVILSNKFERIPSYYSTEEILKILLQVDRNTEIGRRDYIVLILE